MMQIGPPKKQKQKKPLNESGMKGLIDLYKVINDHAYTRVQGLISNSDCIGLTKE